MGLKPYYGLILDFLRTLLFRLVSTHSIHGS